MERMIQLKLEALAEFQKENPNAHVGGSIGLMIRGVDLKRNLSLSDLDITVDEFDIKGSSLDKRSDTNDFDYALRKNVGNGYVKIDIRVNPEPSFDVMEFNGVSYNVSRLRDILFWKTKYANNGSIKHKNDLEAIKTGIRPIEEAKNEAVFHDDDLPF